MDKPDRFNITLKELKQAVEYAEKHGETEHKTITMHVHPSSFMDIIFISKNFDSEKTDITDIDAI